MMNIVDNLIKELDKKILELEKERKKLILKKLLNKIKGENKNV